MNLYRLLAQILMAGGPWNVGFFVILVFFGSFYLINLMLAVVTLSYDEESANVNKEEKEDQKSKDRMQKREQEKADAAKDAAAREAGDFATADEKPAVVHDKGLSNLPCKAHANPGDRSWINMP